MGTRHENSRRVAITGVGVVSPNGIGREAFWNSITAGHSGISQIDLMSASSIPHHIGGQVKDFNDKTSRNYIKQRKNIKVMCREIQLGVAAATLALEDAGITEGVVNPERMGVEFGANLMLSPPEILFDAAKATCDPGDVLFQFDRWGQTGMPKLQPLWLLQFLPNMPACHIGIHADARGPSNSLTMSEASGNLAAAEAWRIVSRSQADVMITGSTGTTIHAVKSLHATLWDELSTWSGDPAEASRPFDADRCGQVCAEGSGVMIFEEEEHAKKRGAKILGYILGAGASCVADKEGKPDLKRAMVVAMKSALKDAGLTPADVGHINAHGLSTTTDDVLETEAIHEVFGDLGTKVPVTAFKSYWGNPGASCGSLELIGSLLGFSQGIVLPTLNYHKPDPACRLNVVHGEPLKGANPVCLKLSVTRIGQASALVVQGA
ncbi:MAG: beta-ketoacyl-[acyl-carrier-protein] synthase family protein [Planctomycetales bacterium]